MCDKSKKMKLVFSPSPNVTTNDDSQVNEWGDQCTNEFFRAMIESGGFYSLEKPGDFTTLVDLSVHS